MDYKVNIPYPEIKVEKENKKYAKILLNIYSGRFGEETSINLLSYESIVFEKYEYIFNEIKNIEIIHFTILGKLIKLLGMKPILVFPNNIDNGFKFWNSSFIDYKDDLTKSLLTNINQKEKIIKLYKENIELINDKNIKTIINRIILDEEAHLKFFNNLLNSL